LSHPGPAVVVLPREIADAITAHARAESPNEACGVVLGSDIPAEGGVAVRFARCRNSAQSPTRYEINPDDLIRVLQDAEAAGLEPWAWFHSHVTSEARPSETDVEEAAWPDQLYLLVSLAPDQADPVTVSPPLRAWRILGGVIHEVALEVT
jgi:[CysO sulfur-carrier protein]-S-L-cysteine hydrolase